MLKFMASYSHSPSSARPWGLAVSHQSQRLFGPAWGFPAHHGCLSCSGAGTCRVQAARLLWQPRRPSIPALHPWEPVPHSYPMRGTAAKTCLARSPALSSTKDDNKSQRVMEGSVHPPVPQLIPTAAFPSMQLSTSCLPEMPDVCTHLRCTL